MDHKISETLTNGTKTIPTGLLFFEILPKNGLFSIFIDGSEFLKNLVESAPNFLKRAK